MFCVLEKRLLLQQLRQWAQGSTQKLLGRADLSDAEHQHLLLTGIYMAAKASRPLRELPALVDIIVLRAKLQALQDSVETEQQSRRAPYHEDV